MEVRLGKSSRCYCLFQAGVGRVSTKRRRVLSPEGLKSVTADEKVSQQHQKASIADAAGRSWRVGSLNTGCEMVPEASLTTIRQQ